MKIANIVYENELINHSKVEYVNYINNPIEYDNIDKSLPTLYVGWTFMKNCNQCNEIIQNADILSKTIINNELYWEYSFSEIKSAHIKGVENFINLAPSYYFSSRYSYVNIDPVFKKIMNIDEIINLIPNKIDIMYIFRNDMIYLLNGNTIWGIDLVMYNFFQFNNEEIISRLIEKSEKVYNDLDCSIYKSYYKIFPNYLQLKRYIVVLLSK